MKVRREGLALNHLQQLDRRHDLPNPEPGTSAEHQARYDHCHLFQTARAHVFPHENPIQRPEAATVNQIINELAASNRQVIARRSSPI